MSLAFLTPRYDAWAVVASFCIAVMASYVALELVRHDRGRDGLHGWGWLLGGSAALGTGVWSMHFMGMLAYRLPMALTYEGGLTFLSWGEAVAASAVALGVASRGTATRARLVAGSLATAIGICAMHYTGMAALRLAPGIVWNPWLVALSGLVAWGSALAALRLFGWQRRLSRRHHHAQLLAALAMGAAITAMHYTGMAAASVPETAVCTTVDGLGGKGLPTLLAVTAIGMLALTLMLSLLDKSALLTRELAAANDVLHSELEHRRRVVRTLRCTLEEPGTATPDPLQDDDLEVVTREVASLVARQRLVQSKLEAILRLSPDGFVSFGRAGKVVHVSQAFLRLTGQPEASVLGLDGDGFAALLQRLCPPGTRLRSLADLRQQGDVPARRLQLQGPPQRTVAVQLFEDVAGPIRGVVCLRDVTREEAVERLKTEFVTTAAHELRTPMASIYGYLELMRRREQTAERRAQTLDIVLRQAQLMTAIVDDLLDLSRLQARSAQDLNLAALDLAALVHEAVEATVLPAGRLAPVVVAPTTPAAWLGDRDRLLRVVLNLLSNAYKYSSEGGEVRLTLERDAGRWLVHVQDQGIGMSAEQLQRLGERFWRADMSGHVPGTGLGICIAREIVALHGGTLGFQSQPGQGTCATVVLPDNTPPGQSTGADARGIGRPTASQFASASAASFVMAGIAEKANGGL